MSYKILILLKLTGIYDSEKQRTIDCIMYVACRIAPLSIEKESLISFIVIRIGLLIE